MRLAALELGSRLSDAGVLDEAEDVFFLHLDELTALALGSEPAAIPDLEALMAFRREEMADFLARPAPDVVRSDGVPVDEAPAPESGGMVGTGVSSGAASGPVKILLEPDPMAMK
ncbi:MAG: hypothetical protein VYE73_09840 [Acidobacteriota bacterium]|nr:hypothetical protein [Acidobacteriota bacterium]